MNARRVVSIHDDRTCPLVGHVIGQEDEDRVWVLWGDLYDGRDTGEARCEWVDELTPYAH